MEPAGLRSMELEAAGGDLSHKDTEREVPLPMAPLPGESAPQEAALP